MKNIDAILEYVGSCFSHFTLHLGEAIFVSVPKPTNGNVKFINNNRIHFICDDEPSWVKCVAYDMSEEDIKLINENFFLFIRMGMFIHKSIPIRQEDIDELDGGDVRLLNILLYRLKNESFIEVNLVGLSIDSLRRVLNYIIEDISSKTVAYVIVNYSDLMETKKPIFLSQKNINDIIDYLERENLMIRNRIMNDLIQDDGYPRMDRPVSSLLLETHTERHKDKKN